MFKPSVLSMDFETALTDGTPSIEYWRHDFRVTSSAFSWRREDGSIKTVYFTSEEETREFLLSIGDIPIVVHNHSFEAGVCAYRFPDIPLNLKYDTMRLAQVTDGGGSDFEKFKIAVTIDDMLAQALEDETVDKYGLGLEKCGYRFLGEEFQGHKQEAYEWLRDNGVKKGREGGNLHLLPDDILKRYNEADAIVTLRLFEVLSEKLKLERYDWTFDHNLYIKISKRIAESKGRGVPVNQEQFKAHMSDINNKLNIMEQEFRSVHKKEIEEIEQEMYQNILDGYKTDKGRNNAIAKIKEAGGIRFNVGSRTQLARLFLDKLGMKAPFVTKKGSPSFKKTHLKVYGEAGLILKDRGTLLISRKQAETALKMSEYDGRIHLGLRATGTKTGRFSGGSNYE